MTPRTRYPRSERRRTFIAVPPRSVFGSGRLRALPSAASAGLSARTTASPISRIGTWIGMAGGESSRTLGHAPARRSPVHVLLAVAQEVATLEFGRRGRPGRGGRGRWFIGSRLEPGQEGALPAVVAVLAVGGRRHHEDETRVKRHGDSCAED